MFDFVKSETGDSVQKVKTSIKNRNIDIMVGCKVTLGLYYSQGFCSNLCRSSGFVVILSASVKCFAGVYFGNCVNQKAQENDHFSCCCDQENNHATAMLYGLVDGRTGFINFN